MITPFGPFVDPSSDESNRRRVELMTGVRRGHHSTGVEVGDSLEEQARLGIARDHDAILPEQAVFSIETQ